MVSFAEIINNPGEYVKGEQHLAVTHRTTSPFMIKGGAGSGKTIVAMLRAIHAKNIVDQDLLDQIKRVCFLTYDKQLAGEVRNCLEGKGVEVLTIDSWVNRFLKSSGYAFRILVTERDRRCLECYKSAHLNVFGKSKVLVVARKTKPFFDNEIAWIKGRGIRTEEDYVLADRSGRSVSLNEENRRAFWTFKTAYEVEMKNKNLETYADLVLAAYDMAITNGIPDKFKCSHALVDEAQDFTYIKLKLTSMMVIGDTPESKGITIVADAAQTIYQSGFSWKDADIAIQGRTKIFKRNYRNTKQIAQAAYSLISQMAKSNPADDITVMDLPGNEGSKPDVWVGDKEGLLQRLLQHIKDCPTNSTRVVAAYSNNEVAELEQFFIENGFSVNRSERVGERPLEEFFAATRPPNGLIHLRTLHRMKGLQFDHVVLWNISKGQHPWSAISERAKVRKLLYVGMTRACSTLVLCCENAMAELVEEIDSQTMTITWLNPCPEI